VRRFGDEGLMRIEDRFAVTTYLSWRDRSRGATAPRPLHRRRRRHAEPRRNRPAAFTRNNGRYNAFLADCLREVTSSDAGFPPGQHTETQTRKKENPRRFEPLLNHDPGKINKC
jgi:hypothetical protein